MDCPFGFDWMRFYGKEKGRKLRDALIIAVDELARWRMKLLSGWKGIAGSFATESGISSVSFIFIGSLDGIRSIPKLDVALSISLSLSLNGPGHVFSSRLVAGGPRPAREDGK